MTDKEELALAVLLWKFLRFEYDGKGLPCQVGIGDVAVAEKSIDLAKQAGCLNEYMALLVRVPVTNIRCEELEEWMESKNGRKPKRSSTFNRYRPRRKRAEDSSGYGPSETPP